MEQAFYISKTSNLKYYRNDFTRLYFGQEFCERLIPTNQQIEEALLFAEKKDLQFTFVTPYVTNWGLRRLEKIIGSLAENKPEVEVVFNDWGIFQFLHEEFPGFVPVMGRLLNKSKRGPRIMNILDKVPNDTKDFFRKSNLNVPSAGMFLKQRGIYRVEFDNLLQGINLEDSDMEIHKSLYIPFAYVSTTRLCLSANCDNPEINYYAGIVDCNKECQEYTFNINNPVMGLPLIRKGNTVFFLNENIPDAFKDGSFDRIVIQPEIPV
jgi:hypothetical protein